MKPIPFRVARVAPPHWNVLKTLIQTVFFWSFFLFVAPRVIIEIENSLIGNAFHFSAPAGRIVGTVLFAVCGTLGITSGVVMAVAGNGTPLPMDSPRDLVIVGPYRYVRNPMAIAGLGQAIAIGIYLGSPAVIAYAVMGGVMWQFLVRPFEEADLLARFGPAYQQYRLAVRCWTPHRRPYSATGDDPVTNRSQCQDATDG